MACESARSRAKLTHIHKFNGYTLTFSKFFVKLYTFFFKKAPAPAKIKQGFVRAAQGLTHTRPPQASTAVCYLYRHSGLVIGQGIFTQGRS